MKSDSIKNLAISLAAAQGEFSAVPKGAENPFFKSKYAALPDVVATATPVLSKNGLSVAQFVDSDDLGDLLTTYLLHSSGEFISHSMRLHVAKSNDPQSQGSAITYARRYSYMSALGLVADNDDDGNAATMAAEVRKAFVQSTQSAFPKQSLDSRVASAAGQSAPAKSSGMATEKMTRMIWAICHKTLNFDDAKQFFTVSQIIERDINDLASLTFDEAKKVIEHLQSIQ
jgi:hypothetical protein